MPDLDVLVWRKAQRHVHHVRFFKSPMDMWNRKHRSYAELAAPHVAKVRYEDLVSDPGLVVSAIQEKFALPSAVSVRWCFIRKCRAEM